MTTIAHGRDTSVEPELERRSSPPRARRARFPHASTIAFDGGVGLFAASIVANEMATEGPAVERVVGGCAAALIAVALSLTYRRISTRPRAILAIAVGSLATAVVIGMRAYAVPKVGLAPVDLVALPTLAVGLVLLAQASIELLRPVRRWWRLLAIPVGIVIVYYLIWPVAIGLMLTHVPRTAVGDRTPGDLGLAYEDVTFHTRDGVVLSGWYLPSENGAAIALLHGAGSTRSNTLDHAALLNEAGYGTLLFDSRGYGRSGGTAMAAGWYGDLDIAAAVDFLSDRPGVDPRRIGVLGLSMGGEEAIAAAASDARIRAVVAEGAGAIRTLADTTSIPGWNRYLGIPHYWLQMVTVDLFTDAPRPIALEDAMGLIAPRPVLLISAGQAELRYAERYQAAASETTELWAPEGTAHTAALGAHPAEYRQRVLQFFDRAIGATG
jgi:fermentation-respiration switch protein FrsA (DUF1100 family)